MRILSLDPGTTQTAWLLFEDGRPTIWDIEPNDNILSMIAELDSPVVYEMITSQGMAVGAETFETVWWIGRFHQHAEMCNLACHRVYRRECKSHLCGNQKAKDANIRQALIDLYGGSSAISKGKKCPECKGRGSTRHEAICSACEGRRLAEPLGVLAGISSHCWAALAVAKTWWDTKRTLTEAVGQ